MSNSKRREQECHRNALNASVPVEGPGGCWEEHFLSLLRCFLASHCPQQVPRAGPQGRGWAGPSISLATHPRGYPALTWRQQPHQEAVRVRGARLVGGIINCQLRDKNTYFLSTGIC